MTAVRTRKSIPPKVAPTSRRLPANQPANRPNAQPAPSAACQTIGIETEAKRKHPNTVAANAPSSTTRAVNPRLTCAIAARTTATANTFTAGSGDVVKENPSITPRAKTAQILNVRISTGHAATIATASAIQVSVCRNGWPSRPVDPAANHAAAMPARRITTAWAGTAANDSPLAVV